MKNILILILLVAAVLPGWCDLRSDYATNQLRYYNDKTQESMPVSGVLFYDEFLNQGTTVPTTAENGYPWIKLCQGTTPTVGYGTDAALGTVEIALSSGNNTQEAVLYMGNQRMFRVDWGTIVEFRALLQVAPSASNAQIFMGLAGDQATGEITTRIGFNVPTGGVIWPEVDDTSTDTSATSGVTWTALTSKIFRIDASDIDKVRFFIDGVQVASSTTFDYGGTGAALKLQPLFKVWKTASTATGSIQIDYVKIWQNRE